MTDREDREDILKLEKVRAKIAAETAAKDLLLEHEQNK